MYMFTLNNRYIILDKMQRLSTHISEANAKVKNYQNGN